ncbi:MAG: hypothetical protein HYV47_03100 [Candidatus Nealsonbacteria bacterium]|nr:hypothetical protein [Candidatus Nealsonbacteria bacterium]
MDINEIKNLIEIDGGKFIIVENGKPTMVVTSFEDYKKKLVEKRNNPVSAKREEKPIPKELESEPLRLEDLPL